jgi:valyl-tRNA synthetase
MSELAKNYHAKSASSKWYAFWEEQGFFHADPHSPKPPYCIVMPPPNVTGVLHMGHALVSTLQDLLVRWKRMSGYEVLWVPGTDHAGIATQTVVEKHLIKTQGKRRRDFSREEFLAHIWEWKEQSQTNILNQLKSLGCSCDWSRLRFTMDAGNNAAVRTQFKNLYDAGLIYRGDYLVNWDPVAQTALADDEVEYEERLSYLWYFKYPIKNRDDFVCVATTRPETMLGDVAVAVSPKDPRYAHLIGKIALLPLMDREIPIIADDHVDPAFGTGMVKITPAHDPNDYQMGLRHNLPRINIMTQEGKINENGGRFTGLSMEQAREAVVKSMQTLGLIDKIEPHVHRVGVSYRSKAVIEPFMSKQWFISISQFSAQMRQIVETGATRLIPAHWESTYYHWIDNLRDWCISRQLWWGHRIPIWYNLQDPTKLLCYAGDGLPPEVAKAPEEWIQDDDVLDTWFSSGLWPFSTLGWPEKTAELERFYPNSTLITGHDILFFWVARMIMMGTYTLDKPPFPEVFLHGLIYGKSYWRNEEDGSITYVADKERQEYDLGKPIPKDVSFRWEKMSKSKGNIIDPREVIDAYGADAMRMGLCVSSPQSREIDLDRRRFEEFRNFTNKIWNGARFVFLHLDGDKEHNTSSLTAEEFNKGLNENLLSLEDRWILSLLHRTVVRVNQMLAAYQFDQATGDAYKFFWNDFCSFYVEIAKPTLFGKQGTPEIRTNKQKLLVIILSQILRLLHPMAPFITEELFQHLKTRLEGLCIHSDIDLYSQEAIRALSSPACMVAPYPQIIKEGDLNPSIEEAFAFVEKVVYTLRNIRGEMRVPSTTAIEIQIIGSPQDTLYLFLQEHQSVITALVRTKEMLFLTEEPKEGFGCMAVVDSLKIRVSLSEELVQQEKARLSKEKERLEAVIDRLRKQLESTEFVKNAPADFVDKQRETFQQNKKEYEEVMQKWNSLQM